MSKQDSRSDIEVVIKARSEYNQMLDDLLAFRDWIDHRMLAYTDQVEKALGVMPAYRTDNERSILLSMYDLITRWTTLIRSSITSLKGSIDDAELPLNELLQLHERLQRRYQERR